MKCSECGADHSPDDLELAFRRPDVIAAMSAEERALEPRFHCVLANDVPTLAPTRGLVARLELAGPRVRPSVWICEADHPLFREQIDGISEHRAHEYTRVF